jgi:hypothetical protein
MNGKFIALDGHVVLHDVDRMHNAVSKRKRRRKKKGKQNERKKRQKKKRKKIRAFLLVNEENERLLSIGCTRMTGSGQKFIYLFLPFSLSSFKYISM